MTDLSRDIGGLEARMDEHDKRFDKLERKIDDGFEKINGKLDNITAEENRRKGALTLIKLSLGAGGLAGAWEVLKSLTHK